MALTTGKYAPRHDKEVFVWKKPDKNGDGENVLERQYSENGQNMGHDFVKDRDGNQVKHYKPPKGFRNIPSRDETGTPLHDNYVLHNVDGSVRRHPITDEAYVIRPGQALVIHPDGRSETLDGEYAQYLFEQAHDSVGSSVEATDPEPEKKETEE